MRKITKAALAASITTALGALTLLGLTTSAQAETVTNVEQRQECTDGGGRVWTGKAVWVGTYLDAEGVSRAKIDLAGITTDADDPVDTELTVKSYNRSGTLIQTLTREAEFDYEGGTVYNKRNPSNPREAGGKAFVQVWADTNGDGFRACPMRFIQPLNLGPVPAPEPTSSPTATPSETVTPSATPSETATSTPTPSTSETATPSATPSSTESATATPSAAS